MGFWTCRIILEKSQRSIDNNPRQLNGEDSFRRAVGGTWGLLQRYLQIIWKNLNSRSFILFPCFLPGKFFRDVSVTFSERTTKTIQKNNKKRCWRLWQWQVTKYLTMEHHHFWWLVIKYFYGDFLPVAWWDDRRSLTLRRQTWSDRPLGRDGSMRISMEIFHGIWTSWLNIMDKIIFDWCIQAIVIAIWVKLVMGMGRNL